MEVSEDPGLEHKLVRAQLAGREDGHRHGREDGERQYSARAAISNAIVRIHARSYGRGPTKARTFLTDDYALCVLEHIFTAAERTLVEGGAEAEVQQMRKSFQRVVADQFIPAVEEITHRKVRAFFSNVQNDPDIAI